MFVLYYTIPYSLPYYIAYHTSLHTILCGLWGPYMKEVSDSDVSTGLEFARAVSEEAYEASWVSVDIYRYANTNMHVCMYIYI